ncbi:hypothetical protein MNBD_GAMMA13-1732, partial [hydrothermal vent metagenome]
MYFRKKKLAACVIAAITSLQSVHAELPVPGRDFINASTPSGVPGTPAASYREDGTNGVVTQNQDKVILNWDKFNITRGNSVRFDQPNSNSVALNRIFQSDPSRINGSLTANGRIYLINSNGIVFGENARVNVHDLIASSLDIKDQVFLKGLANARLDGLAAFDGTPQGNITIEDGAIIETLEGGRVLVVAPEVINRGKIRTPGGQTILAASHDRVYVAVSAKDNQTDDSLIGWFVEVETGGKVENIGDIIAERGNASLVGLAVNQKGRITATTSVDFNGSIRLIARDGARANSFKSSGDAVSVITESLNTVPDASDPTQEFGVTLEPGSITEVKPDLADKSKVNDDNSQPESIIRIDGNRISVESDAVIRATGGKVIISARPGQTDNAERARFSLAPGAIIDASGSKTTVLPMSRNLGKIQLIGNELADFPGLRNGVLKGKKVAFDLRKRPEIGNVQSVYDAIGRDVGERTAKGGTVTITSAAVIDLQAGSQIDISGGLVTYQPGVLETTMLVSQGRVFDFSDAPSRLQYDAVLTNRAPFGLGANVLAGYVEGKDAGSLTLIAPDITLNGDINGHVTTGIFQRHSAAQVELGQNQTRLFDQLPLAGKL